MRTTKHGSVPSTSPSRNIGKLSVAELKAKLDKIWSKHEKLCREQMAPLLYCLRLKLKAQGKSGAGFGAWVEDHLDISRRTADRWANEWAISKGLMKPTKATTFRQTSKSDNVNPDGQIAVPLSFIMPQGEADKFLEAMRILGDRATVVVYEAVISAASQSTTPAQPTQSAA
jgi:hypothetical protein